jgi:hypothetical protein
MAARSDAAILGISDHYGWAVFVTATRDGTLLDRRRCELVDAGLIKHPYHHEGQTLPLEEALQLVEQVRVSAERHAALALDTIAHAVSLPIVGIALRACPPLPPTVAERIRDYRAQCVADSVMYRQELASAAEARGWGVHWYEAKKVVAAAAQHVSDLESHFRALRKSLGPPWTQDHKVALAAAIVAARGEGSGPM